MNYLLMKLKGKSYQPFIKIAFEGLLNNSLNISLDEYLYRGSKMSKGEIDKIMKEFETWKKKPNKNNLPSFILYSRCFLSFSKDEKQVKKFIKKTDENNYAIFFILKNNFNIINNYSSNADIESLSVYGKEKEVVFFPLSCFCLENIYKGNYQGINCVIINLEYLGKYSHILKELSNDENFKNNFINTFNSQNFVKELIKSDFVPLSISEEEDDIKDKNKTKNIFNKIKKIIEQELEIEINEEINNKNIIEENNNIIIEAKEEIPLEEKNPIDITLDEITSNLDKIKPPKNKSFHFYITSFKLEQMNYIYKGDVDSDNKKKYKGKEYDFEDNLVFEGEYYNHQRIYGIEYYIIGTKKFEGEYNNNKRWNGFLYDINNKHKYEINSGKGFIKEFYENSCLAYEGEIKEGEKNGKGKLYDQWGHLIFEGDLEKGIKKGKGILYDFSGNIIFEGEFNNDKEIKGKKYEYNEFYELIRINNNNDNEQEDKNFFGKNDYVNFINIDNCVWIMKNRNKNKKKIKEATDLDTLFEGEYKNGIKFKGKKYNKYGKLIFEGEYNQNGKKWNGILKIKNKLILEGEEYEDSIEYKTEENFIKFVIEEGNQEDEIYKGKEYTEFAELIFEGEYKNGKRYKGKEYNYNGKLIFEGEYNEFGNKWNGIIKEYNDYGKLIFEGEYKEGEKYKGKEYNYNGELIYEGEYKEGKKYKGKKYNNDGKLIYEGEYNEFGNKWNGIIKEYNDYGKLIFEGEYKKGEKHKGKEYNNDGKLIFKGEYNEYGEKCNGIGKEYNNYGKLIFEGEYENGARYKGKEYDYDKLIIFEGEYKSGKYIKEDYIIIIMN